MDPRRKMLLFSLLVVGVVCCSVLAYLKFRSAGPPLPVGVTPEQFAQAARTWELKHSEEPERADVLVTLGDELVMDDATLEAAIACYDAIPTEHLHGPGARLETAKALMRLNRGRPAERNLRAFIDCVGEQEEITHQQFVEVLDMLRFLLEVQLRFEERKDVLRVVHLIDAAGPFETMAYCFPTLLRWNGPQSVKWLETLWEEDPEDLQLRIALGRYRAGQGKLEDAKEILRQCIDQRPEDLAAQAALLACYYEEGDWDAMQQTVDQLPSRQTSDPWLLSRLRGHLHNHAARYEEAVACFEQVIAADPANSESYLGLARAYRGLEREEERQEALRKSQVMARIQNRLGRVLSQEAEVAPLMEIVELCIEIELDEEAQLVAKQVLKVDPNHAEARALVQQSQ